MDKKIYSMIFAGVFALAIAVIFVFFGGNSETSKKSNEVTKKGEIKRESAYYKGNKEARVEIVEFSDLQCPACKMAEPGIKKVLEYYGDKVVFYYRHFPLMQHPFSKEAAKAAEAAGKQGKFWEMHDIIFENQSSLSKEIFSKLARDLNLDMAKYEADFESEEIAEIVKKDGSEAQSLGVNATPTFFLNGEKVEGGGLTFEDWKEIIDKKLAE